MHTLWVCIYEDGTRVYNRPRSYRTSSEVQAYFTGKNRKRWKANGDCNAFMIDDEKRIIQVCYRTPEEIARFEALHGAPVEIRPD